MQTTVITTTITAGTQQRAFFPYKGLETEMRFDGQLDRCVLDNLKDRHEVFQSLDELKPLLKSERWKADGPVDVGMDRDWVAKEGVLRDTRGVSALRIEPDGVVRLSVTADKAPLRQELVGRYDAQNGTITLLSEEIQVTERREAPDRPKGWPKA